MFGTQLKAHGPLLGLIAWRIWSIETEARNVGGRDNGRGADGVLPLSKIVNIIVESGRFISFQSDNEIE